MNSEEKRLDVRRSTTYVGSPDVGTFLSLAARRPVDYCIHVLCKLCFVCGRGQEDYRSSVSIKPLRGFIWALFFFFSRENKKEILLLRLRKIAEETEIRARRYLAGLYIRSRDPSGCRHVSSACVAETSGAGTTSKIRRVGLLTFVLFEVAR
jgi:hypothetical protein